MSSPGRSEDELRAVIEARRELGEQYEPELIESFLDKIEERIDQRVRERLPERKKPPKDSDDQFKLAIVSLTTGIPITAIAGGIGHVPGLVIAWVGIASINVAHALSSRRRYR